MHTDNSFAVMTIACHACIVISPFLIQRAYDKVKYSLTFHSCEYFIFILLSLVIFVPEDFCSSEYFIFILLSLVMFVPEVFCSSEYFIFILFSYDNICSGEF